MSDPIIDIFLWEKTLNTAVAAVLLAASINEPSKQRDADGLVTPRVEIKSVFDSWGPNTSVPHRWSAVGYDTVPDTRDFTLYLTIVTARNDKEQDHDLLVGLSRLQMEKRSAISSKMTYHTVALLVEGASALSVAQDKFQDVTVLTFKGRMRILFDTKTAEIFPS